MKQNFGIRHKRTRQNLAHSSPYFMKPKIPFQLQLPLFTLELTLAGAPLLSQLSFLLPCSFSSFPGAAKRNGFVG